MLKLNLPPRKKVVRIVRHVPGVQLLHRAYWRARTELEFRRTYPAPTNPALRILDFGNYPEPSLKKVESQMCTTGQYMEPEYRFWCQQMRSPRRFSRKQWEFVYILQNLRSLGMLEKGKKGLGFGCGHEPLPSLFARYGCEVVATDQPVSNNEFTQEWAKSDQHASSLAELNERALCPRQVFAKNVSFRPVDMNHIPTDLQGFDFAWSSCCFEHLGSLQHGLNFVHESLRCLKSGGYAVHTTESNVSSNDATMETPGCSLFRKQDFERLAKELEAQGHWLAPLNFNPGNHEVDRHIELPPYASTPHLKIELGGFVATSFGIVVQKDGLKLRNAQR